MGIEELRNKIDCIDQEILDLFEQRMQIVKNVAKYKQRNHLPVFHGDREKQILDRISKKAAPENANGAKVLFSTMMNISKCIQQNEVSDYSSQTLAILEEINQNRIIPENPVFACQGVSGAYSQLACQKKFPGAEITMLKTFDQVFDAVQNGTVDFGVLPIENSSAGSVDEVYRIMKDHSFHINSTVKIKVDHCLAARPEIKKEAIKAVYSMNQALLQCSRYIQRHNFETHQYTNTAAAAKFVSQTEKPYAAICSPESAELYGLKILENNIQNNDENYTRFMIISKYLYPNSDCDTIATSLSLSNSVGSLYKLLTKFSVNGVNLTKIKSMPAGNKNFDVVFYLDFTGNILEERSLNLLNNLSNEISGFKLLGNFKNE